MKYIFIVLFFFIYTYSIADNISANRNNIFTYSKASSFYENCKDIPLEENKIGNKEFMEPRELYNLSSCMSYLQATIDNFYYLVYLGNGNNVLNCYFKIISNFSNNTIHDLIIKNMSENVSILPSMPTPAAISIAMLHYFPIPAECEKLKTAPTHPTK